MEFVRDQEKALVVPGVVVDVHVAVGELCLALLYAIEDLGLLEAILLC